MPENVSAMTGLQGRGMGYAGRLVGQRRLGSRALLSPGLGVLLAFTIMGAVEGYTPGSSAPQVRP
jgi:hypothetical protein